MTSGMRLAAVAAALSALAACANVDGTQNRARTGGLLGATSGAALGGLVSDGDSGTAVVGGLLGAAAGAAIGNRLDAQAAELQQSLGGSGAGITNTGSQLVVNLPEQVTFAFGSDEVRPDFRDDLASVAQNLLNYPNSTVQVVGHTDNVGSDAANQLLSERRAQAVSAVLVGNGVPAYRLQSFGRSFSQPIATNDTETGRAQNRRVEIVITPQA